MLMMILHECMVVVCLTGIVSPTARSERYCHLDSDDDDETNDDESSLELRQFSSVAHRFSKVTPWSSPIVYFKRYM